MPLNIFIWIVVEYCVELIIYSLPQGGLTTIGITGTASLLAYKIRDKHKYAPDKSTIIVTNICYAWAMFTIGNYLARSEMLLLQFSGYVLTLMVYIMIHLVSLLQVMGSIPLTEAESPIALLHLLPFVYFIRSYVLTSNAIINTIILILVIASHCVVALGFILAKKVVAFGKAVGRFIETAGSVIAFPAKIIQIIRGEGGQRDKSIKRLILSTDLVIGTKISEGPRAEVFKGIWKNIPVAVKIYTKNFVQNADLFQREVKKLMQLDHPNVIKTYGAMQVNDSRWAVVSEFMPEGTLHDLIQKKSRLPHQQIYQYASDIAQGLKYLHSQRPTLVHGDLKTTNVLIHDIYGRKRAKMTDIRIARSTSQNDSGFDVQTGFEATQSAHIYSFGALLFEMVTAQQLPKLEEQQLKDYIDQQITSSKLKELKQLIIKCCQKDPKNRPIIDDCIEELWILQHPASESSKQQYLLSQLYLASLLLGYLFLGWP